MMFVEGGDPLDVPVESLTEISALDPEHREGGNCGTGGGEAETTSGSQRGPASNPSQQVDALWPGRRTGIPNPSPPESDRVGTSGQNA